MFKYVLFLFFFPIGLTASEPPCQEVPEKPIGRTRSQDFPGVNVIHRGDTPDNPQPVKAKGSILRRNATNELPHRVEGSRDLRKHAAKNCWRMRLENLLNCCKGGK